VESRTIVLSGSPPVFLCDRGVATAPVIDRITALNFVLYVELIGSAPRHTIRTCRSWTRT